MDSVEFVRDNCHKQKGLLIDLYFFIAKSTKLVGKVCIAIFDHFDKGLKRTTSF